MKPHKPQKQEFDILSNAPETKEERKKMSKWKSEIEQSFYLNILILPRKPPTVPPHHHHPEKNIMKWRLWNGNAFCVIVFSVVTTKAKIHQ